MKTSSVIPGDKSQEIYSKIFQISSSLLSLSTIRDGRFIEVNDAFFTTLGYSREEVIGKTSLELGVFADPTDRKKLLNALKKDGQARNIEIRIRAKDGRVLDTLFSADAITINNEKCWLITATDITKDKKTQEEVSRMAQVIDTAPSLITIHDFNGKFLYANQNNCDMHGYSRDEFMALNLRRIDLPDSEKLITERMRKLHELGELCFEVTHFRKDGTHLPLEILAKLINWGNQTAILSIASDITERKRAEKELRNSQTRFDQLAEQSRTIVWEIDPGGLYTYVSHVAELVFGYRPEELVGKKHFYDLHPDNHRAAYKATTFEVIARKKHFLGFENPVQAKDGRVV